MALTNPFRRPKATSIDVLAALADDPNGLTPETIGHRLRIPADEATSHLEDLYDQHWLTVRSAITGTLYNAEDIDDLDGTDFGGWTLNHHRPGFDTLMAWLEIHHSIDSRATRTALLGQHGIDATFEDHVMTQAPNDTDHEQIPAALADTPLPVSLYRAAAHEARPLWNLPGQMRRTSLFLYYNVPDRDRYERYRDYVHQAGTLTESLPEFPADPGPDIADARGHMITLIRALTDYTRLLTGLGDYYITADTLGNTRNLHSAELARWAAGALAGDEADKTPPLVPQTSEKAAHKDHSGLEDTLHTIDAGHPHGPLKDHAYYRVGGTPRIHDVGTAGEGILATTCYQHAADAAALLHRLETLPHMPEALAATGDSRPSNTLPANPFDQGADD